MVKFVGYYIDSELNRAIKLYKFKCHKHGMVVNYVSGYKERIDCPICIKLIELKNILDIVKSEMETLEIIEKRKGNLTDEQIDKRNKLRFQFMMLEEDIRKIDRRY